MVCQKDDQLWFMFPKGKRLHINKVNVDFDWVGDGDHWRSMSGFLFHLGSTPISYSAKKQSSTTTSLTKTKYKTFFEGSKEKSMWFHFLMLELGFLKDTFTIKGAT